MNERLLQFLWRFQRLQTRHLVSTCGLRIEVIKPGDLNVNQGPDFLDARVRIDNTLWIGNVELHIKSSDWNLHNHSADKNYDNIILHVVWRHDAELSLPFPTLEIQPHVANVLLERFDQLMNNQNFIPCGAGISQVGRIIMLKWKETLMIERLQNKVKEIETGLEVNRGHWEESLWWLVARNFGARVNMDAFEKIAQTIPLKLLARHKSQLLQIEALLLGQAGLLSRKFTDAYPIMLAKEYQFLRKKYSLRPIGYPIHFLRMRPSNFPTVRLAQLAVLIHNSDHLFHRITVTDNCSDIRDLFRVTANDYWHYHYRFEHAGDFHPKTLGDEMISNIMINSIVPMLYAFGAQSGSDSMKERSLRWLAELPPEKNSVTEGFKKLGINSASAFDSQALLQLKSAYCDTKNCLSCMVGNSLLNPRSL